MRGSNLSPRASHTKKNTDIAVLLGQGKLSRDIRAPLGDSRSKCLTEAADCAAKIASGHKLRAGRATKIVGFLNARQTQRRRAPCAWMHRGSHQCGVAEGRRQKLFNIERPKSGRGTRNARLIARICVLRVPYYPRADVPFPKNFKKTKNGQLILFYLLQANRKQTANCCSTGCKIA